VIGSYRTCGKFATGGNESVAAYPRGEVVVENLPKIAVTMGDPAGIGPEIAVRACLSPRVTELCQPVVFGDPEIIQEAATRFARPDVKVVALEEPNLPDVPSKAPESKNQLFVVKCTDVPKTELRPGVVQPAAGRAAAEAVIHATKQVLKGNFQAVVTAPLNKEALQLAGFAYPGHTELLAELCGVKSFAMLLYLPPPVGSPRKAGLAVAHVTLHMAMREIFDKLNSPSVLEKITLLHQFLHRLGIIQPKIGVAALNPHGGEHGIFGNEEQQIIAPAVLAARERGIEAEGPLPADTLFLRAVQGEFDGIVAMYHDQGHIPIKLLGMHRAVNVTVGLPIIRVSVAHGTAFDIAWQGQANPESMIEAICLAARLATSPAG